MWYYEQGLNPTYFWGITDPRNADISRNVGFIKLLHCWIAARRQEPVPSSSQWDIDGGGFFWQYGFWSAIGVNGVGAGGAAAIDDVAQFIGSYRASVEEISNDGKKAIYAISVENTTGWVSGTRLNTIPFVGYVAGLFGSQSAFSGHRRGAGREWLGSRGGDWVQNYVFQLEADPCAKCVLP